MKKFTLFLLMLLTGISASWAEVITEGNFALFNEGTQKYLAYNQYGMGATDAEANRCVLIPFNSDNLYTVEVTKKDNSLGGTQGKYLHIGSGGNWSGNNDDISATCNTMHFYEVVDPQATTWTYQLATEGLTVGKSYVITAVKSGVEYAVTGNFVSGRSENDPRIAGVTFSTSKTLNADALWTVEKWGGTPEPEPALGPLEDVALHNLAGDYLCINGDMNVGTTEFKWDLTAINNLTGAYTVKQHGANYWINSGSSGYLSKANSTGNARHFYFYEVTDNDGATIEASLVTTPKSGKNYLIGVSNVTEKYHGFYIVYGQIAKGKTDRLDVVPINTSAIVDGTYTSASGSTVALIPENIEFTTATTSSNGAINFDKVIWTLEGHTFDMTVPTAGYATLFFDKALAVPTGVTAYTLAENAGGWLDATAVTEIPANTGVVLQAAAGDYNFEILEETAADATSCLQGTLVEKAAPANCLVLGKEDNVIGFYSFSGTLAANKAYYVNASGESNLRVNFDGNVTALDNIVSAPAANKIFDLQGRRVLNAQNGLYIQNGKKVIR